MQLCILEIDERTDANNNNSSASVQFVFFVCVIFSCTRVEHSNHFPFSRSSSVWKSIVDYIVESCHSAFMAIHFEKLIWVNMNRKPFSFFSRLLRFFFFAPVFGQLLEVARNSSAQNSWIECCHHRLMSELRRYRFLVFCSVCVSYVVGSLKINRRTTRRCIYGSLRPNFHRSFHW